MCIILQQNLGEFYAAANPDYCGDLVADTKTEFRRKKT